MWYSSGLGRIELQLTLEQARIGHHPGQCDEDVRYLLTVPAIRRQLAKIPADILVSELKEYGAWDAAALADHKMNLHRILWLACGDICEEHAGKAAR